jgi:hypothetical protein
MHARVLHRRRRDAVPERRSECRGVRGVDIPNGANCARTSRSSRRANSTTLLNKARPVPRLLKAQHQFSAIPSVGREPVPIFSLAHRNSRISDAAESSQTGPPNRT